MQRRKIGYPFINHDILQDLNQSQKSARQKHFIHLL